jgi:MFS family permease
MPNFVSKFFKNLDKRFKVMLIAVGLYNWILGLTSQYDQLYAVALGANPVELGSMVGLGGVANSMISAPAGWLIDKYGVKRMIIFGLILAATVSGIYGFAVDWWILIPAIILAQICMRMIFPLTDIIFVETTKLKERALAMGFSRMIWAIPSVFAPMMAAIIVERFGGINVQGIKPLYYVQLVSIVLVIFFIVFLLKPQQARPIANRSKSVSRTSFIEDFRELFKGEKWHKHWAIIMSLQAFMMNISAPFIPLWMVSVKGADAYLLGIIGTVGIVMSALLQIPAGRLADRIGRKKSFLLLCPFSYLGTILLILAPSSEFLIAAGILGVAGLMTTGGIGSVSFIPFITMFWEAAPADKRGRWYGFTGLFNIFAVPASIIGGFMWQAGFMELVLISPVVIQALIMIPMLWMIPDTLGKSKS